MSAPAQEAARLVYADLLSDAGDPHGEFIVVQCQLAQYERQGLSATPHYAQLKLRERAAEKTLRERRTHFWEAGVVWRKFDRGFVSRLEVRKADAVGLLAEVRNDPLFSAVCRLEICEGTPTAIAALTSLPRFGALKMLRIARKYSTHPFGETGARQLAGWLPMQHVVDLRLRNEQLQDAGLMALLTSPNLRALKRLTVAHNSAGLKGVFSRGVPWPKLTALELSGCRLTASELDDLVAVRGLSELAALSLATNHLGDDGAKVLAASSLPLSEVDLGSTGLTDEGLLALIEPRGRSFKKLVLTSADVGPSVVRMARLHRSLETLMLNETQVNDQHVMAMCGTLDGSLERLSLQGTSVTVKSVEALSRFSKLKALSLARTEIGSAGAQVLANSPQLAALEQLDLDSCELGVEGCRALLASPHLSRQLDLSLAIGGLPESLVTALRSRFTLA